TSPAPASQPAARDVTPPVTLVNVRRRQRLRTLRRRGASVRLRCLEGCVIRSRLEVSRRTARKLGLRVTAGGAVVVGRGETLALTRAASTGFRLRLSRRANGRLRRVRALRLTLRIASTDAGGNTRIVKRTIAARR
ncbi:MAG: hypothetical protein M3375_04635, partial [Actinomycetota bacterium]|nr:hypothetical protein [Actinomycetota bacterium]